MLKVAIMFLSPPKYFISIEIEISAIVLADAQKKTGNAESWNYF